jgi:hypothetical protein
VLAPPVGRPRSAEARNQGRIRVFPDGPARCGAARWNHDQAKSVQPVPAGTRGTLAHPVRHRVNPFFLVLLVVVITAVGTAGEAASREGWLPGVKTWLTIGVITAIVVYAAGILRSSRAARGK